MRRPPLSLPDFPHADPRPAGIVRVPIQLVTANIGTIGVAQTSMVSVNIVGIRDRSGRAKVSQPSQLPCPEPVEGN